MRKLALALILLSAAPVMAMGASRFPPPPAKIADLTLPTGKLRFLAASTKMADFVDLDRSDMAARVIWFYKVMDPPFETGSGPSHQVVSRTRYDCEAHTSQDLGTVAYDENGVVVIWLEAGAPEPVRPHTGSALLEAYACKGEDLPEDLVVVGHAEGLAAGRRILRGTPGRSN